MRPRPSERAASTNSVAAMLRDLGADDPRHVEPRERADRDEERDQGGDRLDRGANGVDLRGGGIFAGEQVDAQAGELLGQRLERGAKQDHDDQEGHRVEGVDDAHHQGVEPPAGVAGDGAPDDADGHRNQRGDQADGERHAAAVEDAREHIAAEVVGAEPVGAGGRQVLVWQVQQVGVGQAREHRADETGERDQDQRPRARPSPPCCETGAARRPSRGRCLFPDRWLRFEFRSFQCSVLRQRCWVGMVRNLVPSYFGTSGAQPRVEPELGEVGEEVGDDDE